MADAYNRPSLLLEAIAVHSGLVTCRLIESQEPHRETEAAG